MNAGTGRVRIGLLDAGVGLEGQPCVVARKRFERIRGKWMVLDDDGAGSRHGNEMARLLASARTGVEIVSARVLSADAPVTPEHIVAGLQWLAARGVHLVSMSFGLHADRPVLREAVAALADEGTVLLASVPARGRPVFPAAYPGVTAVMGDARCHDPQFSHLGTPRAEFGASTLDSCGRPSGASFAVPRIAARFAERLADGLSPAQAAAALRRDAVYQGPERIPGGVAARAADACHGATTS